MEIKYPDFRVTQLPIRNADGLFWFLIDKNLDKTAGRLSSEVFMEWVSTTGSFTVTHSLVDLGKVMVYDSVRKKLKYRTKAEHVDDIWPSNTNNFVPAISATTGLLRNTILFSNATTGDISIDNTHYFIWGTNGLKISHDNSNGTIDNLIGELRIKQNSTNGIVLTNTHADFNRSIHIPDSLYLYLGTDSDTSIIHNGTNFILDTIVGSSYFKANTVTGIQIDTTGKLFFPVDNHQTVAATKVLTYHTSNEVKYRSLVELLSDLGISGNENYVTKFTATGLGDSIIRDDGTNVGVNRAPGTYKFGVGGTGYFSGALTVPTIKLTTNAISGYLWRCTNADGSGEWGIIQSAYKGTWSAVTNTPTLADSGMSPAPVAGDWYRCIADGTQNLGSGNISFTSGDDVYYSGTIWQRVPANAYTLVTATDTILGGIKVGNSLAILSQVLDIKDGDKGDITVSNSGTTWTLDATYDNYVSWTISDGTNTENVIKDFTLIVSGGDALTSVYVPSTNTLTINHDDTSTQASVDNSNGNVIQDVTLDTYGHVTGLTSTDLDTRFALKAHALVDTTNHTVTGLTAGYTLQSLTGTTYGWVAPAALTRTSDTNVTLTLGGAPTTALLTATSLTLGWTGTLAVTRGGTGLSSFTQYGIFYADTTTSISQVGLGTTTTLLHGNAAGVASWGQVVTNDITNNAVTYGKIQTVSTASRVLGRSAIGSGEIEELSIIPTAILGSSYLYIGTTQIALNRASAAQSLTGITSIDGSASKWTTARLLAGNSVDGSANVSFTNSFIVAGTSDAGLTGSGRQFLGALSTGLLKNTITTGLLSIAVVDVDYQSAITSSTASKFYSWDKTFRDIDWDYIVNNPFYLSDDYTIEALYPLNISALRVLPDTGKLVYAHMGVTSDSVYGTDMSFANSIGDDLVWKSGATSDGAGGVFGPYFNIYGTLYIETIDLLSTTSTKILVSDSGIVKYRTPTNILSDLGGVASSTTLTFTEGTGIDITNTGVAQNLSTSRSWTITHEDTSSASSIAVNNSNGSVIQDITVTIDGMGHITDLSSATVDLDGRYFTETESDLRFAPIIHNLIDTTNHPVSGLTTGHVIKASNATTYGFAILNHSDLGSIGANDHHNAVTLATNSGLEISTQVLNIGTPTTITTTTTNSVTTNTHSHALTLTQQDLLTTYGLFDLDDSYTIDALYPLNISSLTILPDTGILTIGNMGVTSGSVYGTEESFNWIIGGTEILRYGAYADGAGGIYGKFCSINGVTTIVGNTSIIGTVSISSTLTLPTFTQGSVLFAGSGGLISEDTAGLYYDASTNRLAINSNTPGTYTLYINGTTYSAGTITTLNDLTSADWAEAHGWGDHSTFNYAVTTNSLSQFAPTTSAQLAGVLSDETGYTTGGLAVFNINPTIVGATFTNDIYINNGKHLYIKSTTATINGNIYTEVDGGVEYLYINNPYQYGSIRISVAGGTVLRANYNGGVELYHNGEFRLKTGATFVSVYGELDLASASGYENCLIQFTNYSGTNKPTQPIAGFGKLYTRGTAIYFLNSNNVETDLTLGGSGTGGVSQVSSGDGMSFIPITTTGAITLGTPSSITLSSTNLSAVGTHYHLFDLTVPVTKGGTNLTTIASGSILAANSANTLTAITWASSGTKILTNINGAISWQTASGGTTISSGILYWDTSTNSYIRYAENLKVSGLLYTVTTSYPTNSLVGLGYDGIFYATRIYEGNKRVVNYDALIQLVAATTLKANWDDDNTYTATRAAISAYVAINAGGGSLWTDADAWTYLTSTTDSLSIGTTSYSAGYKLYVVGAMRSTTGIYADGSIRFPSVYSGTGVAKMVTIDSGGNISCTDIPTVTTGTDVTIFNNADYRLTTTVSASSKQLYGQSKLTFNGTTLALDGSQTTTGNNTTNGYVLLGALQYGRISHNGSQLLIENQATNNSHIYLQDTLGNLYAKGVREANDGWFEGWYYNNVSGNAMKFRTRSWGLEVDGIITSDNDVEGFSSLSDMHLKENDVPIIDGINYIRILRPIRYNWRNNKKDDVGFFAQEVGEIIPSAIWTRQDGHVGLRDERITPFIVSAIQNIDSEIECLKQDINTLKNDNIFLIEKIKELEAK